MIILAAAPLWVPLAVLTAIAVLMTDGRPVFFTQMRAGLGGKPFRLWKFRTMRSGSGDDKSRLTRLGRILRSTSLDELPQLVQVLSGEMALVGPRPLPVEYLPRYDAVQARRHEVRPGITGLAQVNGRNAIDWTRKFEYDVRYVDTRSIALDLRILVRTFFQAIRREGIDASAQQTMPEFKESRGLNGGRLRIDRQR